MDSDLLTVSSADLSLTNNSVDESADVVGLHVLTTDFVHGPDGMMGELSSDDCGRGIIAIPSLVADVPSAIMEKDGEITLNSAFIPENAVLMETPRGYVKDSLLKSYRFFFFNIRKCGFVSQVFFSFACCCFIISIKENWMR